MQVSGVSVNPLCGFCGGLIHLFERGNANLAELSIVN